VTRPTVLVACSSAWASPARLPRELKRAGACVHTLSAPGRPLAVTRYADVRHGAPADLDGFVAALARLVDRVRYDWVLVTDDPLLTALAARRDEPWLAGLLPIAATHPASEALASKAAFCALGSAAGLPIPAFRSCTRIDDAARAVAELGLPLMLKQSSGFAGLGVRLVRAADELPAAWAAVDNGGVIVAQRFVPGPIGNSVALFVRGRLACWMSALKVRTWPGPFGPSSARRFIVHDDAEPLLRRIGDWSGYHGLCAIDWVLDGDGRLQLIELNARPVPTVHMGGLAGVDFAAAMRALLAGQPPATPQRPGARDEVVAMFPEDVWRAASESRLSLGEWLPRRHRYSDVPWHDPPLLAHHLGAFVRAALAAKADVSGPAAP
jgi:predicted ATP-grasp superfamily ATP-dependent carboligase